MKLHIYWLFFSFFVSFSNPLDGFADGGTSAEVGIFSLSERFHSGTIIPKQSFIQVLKAHGYSEVDSTPSVAGQFQISGDTAALIVRSFTDDGGVFFPVMSLVYDFRNGSIQNKLGPSVESLNLEPHLLVSFDGTKLSDSQEGFLNTVKEKLKKDEKLSATEIRKSRIVSSVSALFQQCSEEAITNGANPKALIALDLKTQGVRAWSQTGEASPTTMHSRGGLIRPFIYLTALDANLSGSPALSPLEQIELTSVSSDASLNGDKNETPDSGERAHLDNQSMEPPVRAISFREIAEGLLNQESAAIAAKVGAERIQHTLELFHVKETSLLTLTAAFAALGNGGTLNNPTLYSGIIEASGKLIQPSPSPSETVTDPQTAFVLTDMLRGVVNKGALKRIRESGYQRDIAAAVGIAKNEDAWMIGYSPILAVGVWVGEKENKPATEEEAVDTWMSFMKCADATLPELKFTPPQGVELAAVDRSTNMLATRKCPRESIETQAFAANNIPPQTCTKHGGGSRMQERQSGSDATQNPRPSRQQQNRLPQNPLPRIWRDLERGFGGLLRR